MGIKARRPVPTQPNGFSYASGGGWVGTCPIHHWPADTFIAALGDSTEQRDDLTCKCKEQTDAQKNNKPGEGSAFTLGGTKRKEKTA